MKYKELAIIAKDAAALVLALYIKFHQKKLKDVNCCSEITLHL